MQMEQSRQFIDALNGAAKARVYSYTRFSTPDQALGDSYRRQVSAAQRWATKQGLELDDRLSYFDEGISAFRGTNTGEDKGLGRFLFACREGLVPAGSYLLVESLDRVSRMAPRRAQRLIDEIVDSGVTIVTLNDGQEYTADRLDNDPTALLIALMVSWRAHEESKTKGRRVAAAWAEKRRKIAAGETTKLTERCPGWLLWKDDSWAVDPIHGETVRRVFRMALDGLGEHRIAVVLNTENIPLMGRGKQKGFMWHRSTVAKLLRNPATIGTLTPGRIEYVDGKKCRILEEPIPSAYPSVVSETDWLAVRALKDGQSSSIRGRGAKHPLANLLAGLSRCPDCGASMTRVMKGHSVKGGRPKLVCARAKTGAAKHYTSVPLEEVQAAVLSSWPKLVADIPAGDIDAHLDEEHRDITGTLDALTDHLQTLSEVFERQPSASVGSSIRRLEQEIRTMEELLRDVEERRAMSDRGIIHTMTGQLAELMAPPEPDAPPATIEQINAALRTLFSGVVVDHHAGTLVFHWKQGGTTSLLYKWPDG